MKRYIIGLFGRTGSGKTELVLKMLPNISRALIYDPLHEYPGVVVLTSKQAYDALMNLGDLPRFRIVYRPDNDEDVKRFLLLVPRVPDYTFIAEEVTFLTDPWTPNPEIQQLIRYGRHERRSMIFITQRPGHTNKELTSQANAIISFRQTEPNDLKYCAFFTWDKDIQTLNEKKYEYALHADDYGRSVLKTLLHEVKK